MEKFGRVQDLQTDHLPIRPVENYHGLHAIGGIHWHAVWAGHQRLVRDGAHGEPWRSWAPGSTATTIFATGSAIGDAHQRQGVGLQRGLQDHEHQPLDGSGGPSTRHSEPIVVKTPRPVWLRALLALAFFVVFAPALLLLWAAAMFSITYAWTDAVFPGMGTGGSSPTSWWYFPLQWGSLAGLLALILFLTWKIWRYRAR